MVRYILFFCSEMTSRQCGAVIEGLSTGCISDDEVILGYSCRPVEC